MTETNTLAQHSAALQSAGLGRFHVIVDGQIVDTLQRVAADYPIESGLRWNLSGVVIMDSPTSTETSDRPVYRNRAEALRAVFGASDAKIARAKTYR